MIIPDHKLMRRVAGYHDLRLDGIGDLLSRARGATVLDIGCNRGLVGFEFANNMASLVHGCDNYEQGIATARELFADLRSVKSRFEVVDLTQGADAMHTAFGDEYQNRYDIVLMLATFHKLVRIMDKKPFDKLIAHFGKRTGTYFGWRGTHPAEPNEVPYLDAILGSVGLVRIHYSELSLSVGPAAIWYRTPTGPTAKWKE